MASIIETSGTGQTILPTCYILHILRGRCRRVGCRLPQRGRTLPLLLLLRSWGAVTGVRDFWQEARASSPRCVAEVAKSPDSDRGGPLGVARCPSARLRHLATATASLRDVLARGAPR